MKKLNCHANSQYTVVITLETFLARRVSEHAKMFGSVFFFTALLSSIQINCNPLRNRDLDAIISFLQNRVDGDQTSDESSSSRGGDDAHNVAEYKLKTMDVINLIQQANKDKNREQNDNQRQRYRAHPTAVNLFFENSQYVPSSNEKKSYRLKERLMEQLFQKEGRPLKKTTHQYLVPDRLMNSIQYKNNDDALEHIGGLNEYSKIYVVLDPSALQNSRNENDFSSLVSSILSQTFSAIEKSRQDKNKEFRYKGFMVKDDARRFKRNSKEVRGGDMDEYRPKRLRSEYGGGSGGRTAIPYIRHRGGDVYERDH